MEDGLAGDLAAMWQSELTAMAADRELHETWSALVAFWAKAAAASLAPPFGAHDAIVRSARSTGPAEPARAAASAAASEPGLAEIERLNRRVAELEQRLAGLERRQPAER